MSERIDARIVPAALREWAQWVTWRREQRAGKTTKVPYSALSGRRASVTDARTWSTFDDALAASTRLDGVGFVLTVDDPFVGIDLDHAIGEDGILKPWAARIVSTLNSYTERSPSGQGLHVFVRGVLPPGARRHGNVEMYESERYFTITAEHLDGTPTSIEERADALFGVHAEFVARERLQKTASSADSSRDDEGVLTLLFGERAGAKWRALYNGQWNAFYPSQSEADAALARKLRFYTSGSKEQTRRLLLASGLRREKWDEGRGSSTFFEASVIDAAFRQGGKVYVPREPHAEPNGGRFALIPDWVADRISASDLRVYRALGSFANRERTCFPSVATLATIARISERRVQVALRRLETAQCITTQRRWNASSLYMLPLRPPEQRGDGIDTPSGTDEEQRGDVFSVSLEEQRGDENIAPFVDENSKGVTFSHQRGDVFVHPKQYQEEVLAHEVREASALIADTDARAMQKREVLSDGRPRVLLPSEIGEADLMGYALAKTDPKRGERCGDCVHCGRSECWYDRATQTVGCIACDPMPGGAP